MREGPDKEAELRRDAVALPQGEVVVAMKVENFVVRAKGGWAKNTAGRMPGLI